METLFEPGTRAGIVARDYQLTDHDESFRLWDGGELGTLTRIFTGGGKCLGRGTMVMLFSGTIKPVEEIAVGDLLMGPDSKPRRVLRTNQGVGQLFRITPNRGEPFVVNDVHVLTLKATNFSKKINTIRGMKPGQVIDISLDKYLAESSSFKHIMKGFRVAVEFHDHEVPLLNPYFLGVWLGDGTFKKPEVTTADQEIVDALATVASEFCLDLVKVEGMKSGKATTWRLRKGSYHGNENPLLSWIKLLIKDGKRIPHVYKTGSRETRLQILAGLLDTDGCEHHGGFDYISKIKGLSEDVAFVARSLGLAAYVAECQKTCTNNGTTGTYWRVSISGDCSVIPTRIARKRAAPRKQKKDHLSFGFAVEPIGEGEYFGFTLSGDGRFLLGDFTVTHNTICACMKMNTWLRRGEDYRCMVVSYETQLVWQFAQEIEEVLGIRPGIEMDAATIDADDIPKISVVSRASLLRAKPPTPEQIESLGGYGVMDLGACPERSCKRFLRHLERGGEADAVRDEIARLCREPEAHGAAWSRLHKFDNRLNWLIVFDEAHRHAYHLTSVGHIVDWFEQNPKSRRTGMTATPKRGDQVSVGDKMFPGIAVDYPLYSPSKPCGVKDGWAVPYVQKYIDVEGVDFKSLAKLGEDFDEADLERKLGEEKMLATLVLPLLDMVENRRTLIFSPGVEMAKNVARFINARVETKCTCGLVKWQPRLLIGDGAACACGRMLEPTDITKSGDQARELDGASPEHERKQVYLDHQSGKFQFLSVCGLCREGYNDPSIACVAVFRPVSKKASSLAEQMKGRSCRPLRGLLNGLATREERLAAIAASSKPNALIVDLVGITGLADCASTVMIYAEGLPDKIVDRASEILADEATEEEMSVEDAIGQAQREDADARAKVQAEREQAEREAKKEAERRAKANAEATYTAHDVGTGSNAGPKEATEAQEKFIRFLGMNITKILSKGQAGRIISLLKKRTPFEEVARVNRIEEGQWTHEPPSLKARNFAKWKGVPAERAKCGYDLSQMIDAKLEPEPYEKKKTAELDKAKTNDEIEAVAQDLRLVHGILKQECWDRLVKLGKARRATFTQPDSEF
jgi:superfamily II DNA or RNA helicase